jgi:hypothetical protein
MCTSEGQHHRLPRRTTDPYSLLSDITCQHNSGSVRRDQWLRIIGPTIGDSAQPHKEGTVARDDRRLLIFPEWRANRSAPG